MCEFVHTDRDRAGVSLTAISNRALWDNSAPVLSYNAHCVSGPSSEEADRWYIGRQTEMNGKIAG